jgi:FeS assembly SUF system protein
MDKQSLEKEIIKSLRTVYDEEIPVNVYDLGLIYEIKISDDFNVYIKMTLTSPNCPMAEEIPAEVRQVVKATEGVKEVDLELTFDPPWDRDMMSEDSKLELGLL